MGRMLINDNKAVFGLRDNIGFMQLRARGPQRIVRHGCIFQRFIPRRRRRRAVKIMLAVVEPRIGCLKLPQERISRTLR